MAFDSELMKFKRHLQYLIVIINDYQRNGKNLDMNELTIGYEEAGEVLDTVIRETPEKDPYIIF